MLAPSPKPSAASPRYATLAQEVEDDVADYRDLTPEENDAVVRSAGRAALEILRGRPDFEAAMAEVDPPAPDFEALWKRLMARKVSSGGQPGPR